MSESKPAVEEAQPCAFQTWNGPCTRGKGHDGKHSVLEPTMSTPSQPAPGLPLEITFEGYGSAELKRIISEWKALKTAQQFGLMPTAAPGLSECEVCKNCTVMFEAVWHADDVLWRQVRGGDKRNVCMACFDRQAQQKGIRLTWTPSEMK